MEASARPNRRRAAIDSEQHFDHKPNCNKARDDSKALLQARSGQPRGEASSGQHCRNRPECERDADRGIQPAGDDR